MNDLLIGFSIIQGLSKISSGFLKKEIEKSKLSSMLWFLDNNYLSFESNDAIKYGLIKMELNNKQDSWKFRAFDSATQHEAIRELRYSINKVESYFIEMIKKYPNEFKQAFPEGF